MMPDELRRQLVPEPGEAHPAVLEEATWPRTYREGHNAEARLHVEEPDAELEHQTSGQPRLLQDTPRE
jgi:hypothetical protein